MRIRLKEIHAERDRDRDDDDNEIIKIIDALAQLQMQFINNTIREVEGGGVGGEGEKKRHKCKHFIKLVQIK